MHYCTTCCKISACDSYPTFCFFFNDTATTEIYTLSLHDALPILSESYFAIDSGSRPLSPVRSSHPASFLRIASRVALCVGRSEEHTSELQSQSNLVCRLLLEKNNISSTPPSPSAPPRPDLSPRCT